MYQHNGVCFEHPESWEVVEDDGDETIRAITIECPNNGYYSMDIYNSEQAPSIEKYIERSLNYFIDELPFGFKIIEKPTQSTEKVISKSSEIDGIKLEFTVRTLFRQKIRYINSYFRVCSGTKTSLISGQYLAEHSTESRVGFNQIVSSFSVV